MRSRRRGLGLCGRDGAARAGVRRRVLSCGPAGARIYSPPLRATRGIRRIAWGLVVVGVAAPALRRRLKVPPAVVLASAAAAPAALAVAAPRSRARDIGMAALNMWAYIAAYEMPHDDPQRLEQRVLVDYPIAADRVLGLGVPPTLRLQGAFSAPGTVNRFERVLAWSHWLWFAVPHSTAAYVLWRDPERFPSAAARMYAVFDVGAIFYWAIPTAPPWWAAEHGGLDSGRGRRDERQVIRVRRMMIEYGPVFWGDLWGPLYDFLGGNPLAAMPSLHFATSLMGAHLLGEVGPVAGAVGWTYAATLGLALVYLGEHYAIDLIGGAALAEGVRVGLPRLAPLYQRVSRTLQGLEALAAGH
jgi:membrane-associated phospholipid phosphatase